MPSSRRTVFRRTAFSSSALRRDARLPFRIPARPGRPPPGRLRRPNPFRDRRSDTDAPKRIDGPGAPHPAQALGKRNPDPRRSGYRASGYAAMSGTCKPSAAGRSSNSRATGVYRCSRTLGRHFVLAKNGSRAPEGSCRGPCGTLTAESAFSKRFLADHHPRQAAEIGNRRDRTKSGRIRHGCHRRRLGRADFEGQKSAWRQQGRGLRDDPSVGVEPVGTAVERRPRIVSAPPPAPGASMSCVAI